MVFRYTRLCQPWDCLRAEFSGRLSSADIASDAENSEELRAAIKVSEDTNVGVIFSESGNAIYGFLSTVINIELHSK